MRFATRMMCVASEPIVNEIYDPAVSLFFSSYKIISSPEHIEN